MKCPDSDTGREHEFDEENRCKTCGRTWLELVRGFGIGGFTTKSSVRRPLKGLSG
jgi:hypothetical protein